MKKFLVWSLIVVSLVVLGSCTFKGTATFRLKNDTTHNISAVNFVAVVGGETDNNAVSLSPGDGRYFYSIEPGTYDITLTVDGVGTFVAFNDFVVEEGVVYFRDIDDNDLP